MEALLYESTNERKQQFFQGQLKIDELERL